MIDDITWVMWHRFFGDITKNFKKCLTNLWRKSMSSSSTSKNYEIKKGPLKLSICFAAKLLRKFKPFPQLPGKEHNRAISE